MTTTENIPPGTSMYALVLHAVDDLRYEAVPRPQPGPGEALVRVGFCGVCGSDIPRCFTKGTYNFPTICGHEFAGVIESLGDEASGFAPGDRVAVFPLLWCGRCAACETGKYVQCVDYDYLGSRSDGGFAEYVVAPVKNLLRVPDNVTLEEASMTEPAAVALHAARRANVRFGDSVAIFGAGPIGLMTAQWVRKMGAAKILLFDLVAEKLALARQLGFELAFNSRDADPQQVVASHTHGNGVQVSIEAAGVPPTMIAALQATARGGRTVLLGNPSADVTLPAALISQLMRREVDVVGTWNSDYSAHGDHDDWRTSLAAMASGRITLSPLITHRVPLSRAKGALEMMRKQREFYAKVLIHPEN